MSSTVTKVNTVRDNMNSSKLGVQADAELKAPLGDILSILLDTRNPSVTVSGTTVGSAVTPSSVAVSAATAVSPASAAYATGDQTTLANLANALRTDLNLAVTDIANIGALLNQARADILNLRSALAAVTTGGVIGGATETGKSVTSSTGVCAALSQAPTTNGLITVNATAGTTAGVKKIMTDPTRLPNPGEVYWDGGVNLTFNIADAVTSCDVIYSKSDLTQAVSCLMRSMPE